MMFHLAFYLTIHLVFYMRFYRSSLLPFSLANLGFQDLPSNFIGQTTSGRVLGMRLLTVKLTSSVTGAPNASTLACVAEKKQVSCRSTIHLRQTSADHLRRNCAPTFFLITCAEMSLKPYELQAKYAQCIPKNDTMGHLTIELPQIQTHFGHTFLSFTLGRNGTTRDMTPLGFICCCASCKKSHDTFRVYMFLHLM